MTSCFEADIFRRIGLFQAPQLTRAHKCVGVAAILGFFFVLAHICTVIVTIVYEGGFGTISAWCLDIIGAWLAGLLFTVVCRKSSNLSSAEGRKDTMWILFWSSITLCVRCIDVLNLFGVVLWLYDPAPEGPVLYANIVSSAQKFEARVS